MLENVLPMVDPRAESKIERTELFTFSATPRAERTLWSLGLASASSPALGLRVAWPRHRFELERPTSLRVKVGCVEAAGMRRTFCRLSLRSRPSRGGLPVTA